MGRGDVTLAAALLWKKTEWVACTSRRGTVLDDREPACVWLFFDDEPNLRRAENAFQRTKFAKSSKIFLCGYGEGTQAIGAGDDVIFPIPRYPDGRLVSLDCRTRWSFTEQLCNLCLQFLELKWFGKE